jgi:RimJ/RimL family protein N-acetyltransferase
MRTTRLDLPRVSSLEAESILGLRAAWRPWGPGYPTEGDLNIARLVCADPQSSAAGDFGPRTIVLQATGEAIGGIGFFGPPVDGELAVGYGVAELFRGRGLVSEALRAMLTLAAAAPEVRRVYADTDPDNMASQHVLLACGFIRGMDREHGLRVFRWSRREE